jgi:hypothetical protein
VTVAEEEPGMFHVFPILMPWAEASRRAYRSAGEFVDRQLPEGDAAGNATEVTGGEAGDPMAGEGAETKAAAARIVDQAG